eukprot:gnl/TRDRNA2_/TRDRNA2_177137_c0_seq1.p1 gnl/TRDRNA2_/TRDRNA2_177137_c0~~gnl/TRDRNA2_/TRDRNA2_177137_c0_seq1.p1  ORF type:complete len:360 (+),score=-14.73 gnl/TRDRNA2_/TRDRNA2_177137_c0_seq1:110-1189(+)
MINCQPILNDQLGITRDRLNCFANWNGIEFQISDTAGILSASSLHCMKSERKKSEFSHTTTFEIMQQTNLAIKDSDVLVMVVDGLDGPTDHDNQIITWLRRYYGDKHIILAVNKCDKEINADIQSSYFWELGLEPIPTSAIISSSINNLLDSIVEAIPNKSDYNKVSEEKPLKVTFIGRPNVGKSSLLNSILAEKRHIVSELPGSTRDAIETPFLTPNGHFFTLVDTFGIGKKSSYINSAKETSLSAQQTLRRIRLTDVVVLVLDVTEGVTVQDFRLSENIVKEKKACLIVMNKWDLLAKRTPSSLAEIQRDVLTQLRPVNWAPVVFASAKKRSWVKYGFAENHLCGPRIQTTNNNCHI